MKIRYSNYHKVVFGPEKSINFVIFFYRKASESGWGLIDNGCQITEAGIILHFVKFSDCEESLEITEIEVAADVVLNSINRRKIREDLRRLGDGE